jgi:deoxyguanosine kinase
MNVSTDPALRFRHIAIEGPIGAGKSTLARALAPRLDAQLLQERAEDNPFLAQFYAEAQAGGAHTRNRLAFQTQLFFLLQRVEQARELAQPGMFAPLVVSDFMFDKDALFARLTLSDDEYRLYLQIARGMAPQLPPPDLVIWLQASPRVLLQRVHRRGLPMEQQIEPAYVAALSDAYADYFEHHPALPVLVVDAERFDAVDTGADIDRLLEHLRAFVGPRESLPTGP